MYRLREMVVKKYYAISVESWIVNIGQIDKRYVLSCSPQVDAVTSWHA